MYSEHLVELILAQLYLRFKGILMIFTYNPFHFTKQTADSAVIFFTTPQKAQFNQFFEPKNNFCTYENPKKRIQMKGTVICRETKERLYLWEREWSE